MSTAPSVINLDQIRIASPCSERWEDMIGDDRTRRCRHCNLDVHNISTMTRSEGEAFLARATDGRMCVRLYRRADGTVLTSDCPIGLARIRAGVFRTTARLAAAIGLVAVAGAIANELHNEHAIRGRLRDRQPFAAIGRRLWPAAYSAPIYQSEMGSCCSFDPAVPAPSPVSRENP
jgi:hypothetical protein